jgi:hypothetical protein
VLEEEAQLGSSQGRKETRDVDKRGKSEPEASKAAAVNGPSFGEKVRQRELMKWESAVGCRRWQVSSDAALGGRNGAAASPHLSLYLLERGRGTPLGWLESRCRSGAHRVYRGAVAARGAATRGLTSSTLASCIVMNLLLGTCKAEHADMGSDGLVTTCI